VTSVWVSTEIRPSKWIASTMVCYFLVEDSSHGHVRVTRRDGDRASVRPGRCDGPGGRAVIGPSAEGGPSNWRCQRHGSTNGIRRRAY
jgi:hypothetical protein